MHNLLNLLFFLKDKNKQIKYEECFFTKILDALKGQKFSRKFGFEFEFIYESNQKNGLPTYVKLNGFPSEKKPFADVWASLCEQLINHKLDDLNVKWIRSTLGLILINHIFKDEILTIRREHRAAINRIRMFLENQFDNHLSILKLNKDELLKKLPESTLSNHLEQFEVDHIVYWILYHLERSKNIYTWVETSMYLKQINKKKLQKIINDIKNIDRIIIPLFMYKKYNLEEDNTPEMDYTSEVTKEELIYFIEAQKEAFFWEPGKTFLKERLIKVKKALHIAFFYRWMRICSGIKPKNIVNEINVHKSTVSRWNTAIELELRGYFEESFIFFPLPITFSKEALNGLGMFDYRIRTYRLQRIEETNIKKSIVARKKALWYIYTMSRDNILLDSIAENEMNNLINNQAYKKMENDFEIEYLIRIDKYEKNDGKVINNYILTIKYIKINFI